MNQANTPCGIAIPQVFVDGVVDLKHIRSFLERAEALGYDSAWTQETVLSPFAILEPLSLLSYASAVTTRMRLGVSVMLTTLRNPIQLAKTLSSLDHLSGGRLDVGVGAGGHVDEATFGYSKEGRIRRFTEGIEVMKALWTQPKARISGRFWNLEDAVMEPKPVQRPHPPIWFGARIEPALRRAVRLGDGWMGSGSSSTGDFVKQCAQLHALLEEAGRDPATYRISKRVYVAVDTNRDRAEKRLREWFGVRYGNADMATRDAIWGSSAECLDKIAEIVGAGAEHLLFNPVFDEVDHLELLAEEIVPKL